MSELDNTNELDNYGVWVKNPPKTVDSSSTQTETSNDIFNISADLPDFSDLDVVSENTGSDDYDNNDTSLSQEELNAIAGVTADSDAEDSPEGEHAINENGEKEISLDEFLDGGVFQTGPDEDKIREHEGAAAAESNPEPEQAQTEDVDLSDFGVEDTSSTEVQESEPQTQEATTFEEADNNDIFNIDLFGDDSSSAPVSEDSSLTSEPSFETPVSSAESPAGTEDVDLSEFGLSDFSDDSSTASTDSSESAADDGMESVDLSEFGFEDTSSDDNPVQPEKEAPQEETVAEAVPEAPAFEEPAVSEEVPAEENDDDFTVSADDIPEPEADSVSEEAPKNDFVPAEDTDFDVDSLLANVEDENGKTTGIGNQEENMVKEVADIPSDEPVLDIPSEEIEDLNSTVSEEPVAEIPDTFDEEANALLGSDPADEADQASVIADSIKAPILEEMESNEEQPSSQMTAIFSQIVGELSSLKDEIASLKNDLSALKQNNSVPAAPVEEKVEDNGFFSNTDEDDTIALSNDELDNILNTASFSNQEEVTPDSSNSTDLSDLDAGDDEVQPALELPVEDVPADEESPVDIPDDDFSENTNFDVDFNNENLEEPTLESVDYSAVSESGDSDLPDEISVPKSDELIVESSSSDLMDSVSSDAVEGTGVESAPSEEDFAAFADFSKDDPSISDTLTADKIDYLSADTDKAVAESESQAVSNNESIPGDLKTEIKSVLSYMDQLLENLPEDKIAEFAQSEQFDTYKKLFKELGLA